MGQYIIDSENWLWENYGKPFWGLEDTRVADPGEAFDQACDEAGTREVEALLG